MTPEERAEVQRRIDAGLVTRCPPGIAAGVTQIENLTGVYAYGSDGTVTPFAVARQNAINNAKLRWRKHHDRPAV